MRSYWIKIAAGALGIFTVGMLGITGFRSVKGKVHHAINSTDPITIPLIGLVPFRVDNDKLGSVSRVEFLRSDPEHVAGVRVVVKLADSIGPDRLAQCQLTLDNVDNIDERTTFRCGSMAGPIPAGLEQFGTVDLKNGSGSFPLLLPTKAVADLRQTRFRFHNGVFEVSGPKDEVGEAINQRADSMREEVDSRIEARQDSVDELRDLSVDLEDSSTSVPLVQRRQLQRSADSVRSLMRAMVDRLKADETRLNVLGQLSGLTPEQRESLNRLSPKLSDSIQLMVQRELKRVQVELEKAGIKAKVTETKVEGPATVVRPR